MLIESLSFSNTKRAWSAPIPSRMDSPKTLVIVFGTPDLHEHGAALQELTSGLPRSHIIGCSSPSLMAGKDVSLHAVIAQFSHTTLTSTMSLLTDAVAAGQAITRALAKPNLRAVLTFADATAIDGNALTRGLSSLDSSIPVFGALSGGDGRSSSVTPWILAGGLSKPGMTAAIGLYGDHVLLRSASRTGWEKFGPERTVTKADGPVVYELDGKPALSVYDECLVMLGKTRATLPNTLAVPFAVRATARHDRSLIRSIVAIDEKNSALRFSVDIPQGYLAQPLQAKAEALLASCADAVTSVSVDEPLIGINALAIAVSHVGRRLWVDGSGLREEVAVIADSLPKPRESGATTLIGMYGFGELTSLVNEHAQLNNQSFALGLIMESETPLARRAAPALAGAGGAIRAQAPTTKAGPAAHLRSKTPTVDDLFSEIELDGGAAAAGGHAPPPAPPSRPSSQTQPLLARKPPPPVPPPPISSSRRSSGHHETSRPPPGTTAALVAATAAFGSLGAGGVPTPRRRGGTEASSTSAITPTRLRYQGGAWTTPPEGIDGPRTLAVVFGPASATNAVQDLQQLLPNSHIIGCATDRALGAGVIETTAQLTTFERTDVHVASAEIAKGAAIAAAAISAELDRPNLRCVILLSDHSSTNGEIVTSLRQSLSPDVAIVGGVSSAKNAWVVADKHSRGGLIAAAGLYGDFVSIGHSHVAGEFEPLGPERPITRAADRLIFEVDGRAVLPFLMEQIGATKPEDVLRLPLLLSLDGRKLGVGVIAAVDPAAKSITMSLPVAPGTMMRLARVDHERLLDEVAQGTGLAKAANVTTEGPVLVFMASSMLRQRVLLDRAEEQVEAAADVLPKQVIAHTIGFSSIAEIGRLGGSDSASALHSGTVSMLIVSESRASLTAHVDPAETPSPVAVAAQRRGSGNGNVVGEVTAPMRAIQSKPPKSVILRAPLEVSGTTAGAKITKTREGDVTVVSFSGRLTESFKGENLGRELSGTVLFDLSKVERVTSFGVREWLSMLNAMQDRVKKLFYSHCSEAIVNQLSMIRKFSGRAQVISAFGPFLCDSCGEQFERLFDIEADAESIQSHVISDVMCPQCGARAHFDDDPETYFTFAPSHLGQVIPPAIRTVHDGIEAAAPVRAADSIDKAMEGNITRIRVTGRAATVRWQRVFDGSEGTLILDLGGVVVDEPGIQSLEGALLQVPSDVEVLRLERAPQALVDKFAVSGVPRKVLIASTTLVGFCASCNNRRPALLLVDDHLVAISAGRAPAINCRRCNGPLDLVDAQTTLTVLAKHRRRVSTAPGRISSTPAPPIVAVASAVDQQQAVAPSATLPILTTTPSQPLGGYASIPIEPATIPSERPTAARGSGGLILASAALVSIALAGSAAAIIISRRAPAPIDNNNTTTPVATAPPPSTPAPPSNVTADLPPGWADRTFVIDGETVFVVGRAEKGASPEAALEIARTDATLQLLKQLHIDLAGTPSHDLVAARIRPAEYTQHAAKATERFFRQTPGIPGPERAETVIRRKDGAVEAYARFRLARASYNALVARYKKTTGFHGMTIGRVFPLVSPDLTDIDGVVVSVQNPRVFDGPAPHPGDLIKLASGRPFTITDTLAADDWLGVNPNESLVLDLDRDGAAATAKIRRAAVVAFVGAPRNPNPPPAPPPAAPPSPPATTTPPGPAPPATSYREGFAAGGTKEVSAKSAQPSTSDLPALNYRDTPAAPTPPPKPKK
jgi:hypothetical protein